MLATLASLLICAAAGAGQPPTGPQSEDAAALARRSVIEYDAGEFDKALADATRAYELDPHPEMLFNLGQCHRALGHWQQAEFFYRGFLRQRPDTEARPKVEKLIAKMVAKQQEAAPQAVPAEPLVVPVPVLPAAETPPPERTPGAALGFGAGATTGVAVGPMVSVRLEAGLHTFYGPYLTLDGQTSASSSPRETSGLLLAAYRFGLKLQKVELFAAPAIGGGLVVQTAPSGASFVGALAAEIGAAYDFDGRYALELEGELPLVLLQQQATNSDGMTTRTVSVVALPAVWLMLRLTLG